MGGDGDSNATGGKMAKKRKIKKMKSEVKKSDGGSSYANKIQKVEELQVDPDEEASEEDPEEPENQNDDEELKEEGSDENKENEAIDEASQGGMIQDSVPSNCGFPELNESDGETPAYELLTK